MWGKMWERRRKKNPPIELPQREGYRGGEQEMQGFVFCLGGLGYLCPLIVNNVDNEWSHKGARDTYVEQGASFFWVPVGGSPTRKTKKANKQPLSLSLLMRANSGACIDDGRLRNGERDNFGVGRFLRPKNQAHTLVDQCLLS